MGANMAQNQTENVTIEFDKQIKASGEALFRSLGMNFSTAVNVLVKQAVQMGRIPSEGSDSMDNIYSAELEAEDPFFFFFTQTELARRIKNLDNGVHCAYHELIETD
jgi:addiction module RelB/DinJ family antitoxin